jgi:hypothetical protein
MPGLGKKTFTAGDVLIAGDVNNYLMDQTVMNFAGTAARNAAIPVPSTGMTTYIGTTGTALIPQIEFYTGSTWQTPYGITLLANVSFTAASSVIVDNVFNSTYQNYLIIFVANQNTATGYHTMRLRAAGTDNANGFYGGGVQNYSTSNTLTSYRMNGGADYTIGSGTTSVGSPAVEINVYAPNQAVLTRVSHKGMGDDSSGTYSHYLDTWYNGATQFDGFKIVSSSGTITGSVRLYGLRNS